MSYNGSPFAFASLAIAGRRSLGRNLATRIFWRELMAALAMRHGLQPFPICKATGSQASKIDLFVFRENFSWFPPQRKASTNSIVMKAGFFRPLHDGFGHSLVRYANITFSVIGLFLSRSPAAIIRAVAFGIINAFQGKAFGPWSHVFLKSQKIIPPRTNFNATAPVSVIMRGIGVIASGAHLQPYAINKGPRFTMFSPHVRRSVLETVPVLQRKRKVK